VLQDRVAGKRAGGYEIQLHLILSHLVHRGWEVHYVAFGEEAKSYHLDGINVHQLPGRYSFNFNTNSIYRLIRHIPFNIILQRSRTQMSSLGLGYRISRRTGAPFVFSLGSPDDLFSWYQTRQLFHRKDLNFLSKGIVSLDTLPKDILFRLNFRRSNLIVAQTRYQQNEVMRQFGRYSPIVRSGHPLPSSVPSKENPPVISWIANARPVKRPEIFVELAAHCLDLYSSCGLSFVMVLGSTYDRYRNTPLFNRAASLANLKIYGSLTSDEANDLMGRSLLLVNTSVYEGFSNTYIQAWLRATPVISIECDPDDIIRDHGVGRVSGSFNQLIEDVRFYVSNVDAWKTASTRAREYAIAHHHIESTASQWDQLLRQVLNHG
jgi:glycosyltransferase involved in cell wall biosynthesis